MPEFGLFVVRNYNDERQNPEKGVSSRQCSEDTHLLISYQSKTFGMLDIIF